MTDMPATDFEIADPVVELLTLLTRCPGPERESVLLDLARRVGPRVLARQYAQFIGLANSVIADPARPTMAEALAALKAGAETR